MVDLTPKSPCAGLLPFVCGRVQLTENDPGVITSVAPFAGKNDAVSVHLAEAIGVGLPETGSFDAKGEIQVIWAGQGQYFIRAGQSQSVPGSATTDQSDAWACVLLQGEDAADVMARLCPLDLRRMAEGHVARSLIGHMNAVILRREIGFEIMVFRSMAKTLVHEVSAVMRSVAAQRGATQKR